jgi:hypothetical protein
MRLASADCGSRSGAAFVVGLDVVGLGVVLDGGEVAAHPARPARCARHRGLGVDLLVERGPVCDLLGAVRDAEDGVGGDEAGELGGGAGHEHGGGLLLPAVLGGEAEVTGAVHGPDDALPLVGAAALALHAAAGGGGLLEDHLVAVGLHHGAERDRARGGLSLDDVEGPHGGHRREADLEPGEDGGAQLDGLAAELLGDEGRLAESLGHPVGGVGGLCPLAEALDRDVLGGGEGQLGAVFVSFDAHAALPVGLSLCGSWWARPT